MRNHTYWGLYSVQAVHKCSQQYSPANMHTHVMLETSSEPNRLSVIPLLCECVRCYLWLRLTDLWKLPFNAFHVWPDETVHIRQGTKYFDLFVHHSALSSFYMIKCWIMLLLKFLWFSVPSTVVLASNMSCYVILVQNCRDIAALAVTGSSKLSQTVALQTFLTRPMHKAVFWLVKCVEINEWMLCTPVKYSLNFLYYNQGIFDFI